MPVLIERFFQDIERISALDGDAFAFRDLGAAAVAFDYACRIKAYKGIALKLIVGVRAFQKERIWFVFDRSVDLSRTLRMPPLLNPETSSG
jgi:hypothetical protein